MRDLLDRLGQAQEEHIQALIASLGSKRDKINGKEQTIMSQREGVVATAGTASRRASFMITLFVIVGAATAAIAAVCRRGPHAVHRRFDQPGDYLPDRGAVNR